MDKLFCLIFAFFSIIIQSQTLEGKVYDSETKQPLEFVNVFFKKTTYGTFTNDKGEFKLDFINENDTLYFSTIGYKIQKFRISDIVSTKEFYLAETKKKLDEIVLLGEKLEYASSKKIKENLKAEETNYFSFQLGTEHCIYIPNNSRIKGKIQSLVLDLKEVKDGTKDCRNCKVDYITDFNIKFYEYDVKNKKPGNEIYSKPIFVELKNKTYSLNIDVEAFNIPFLENGICVGVEVINTKYKKPKLAGAFTAPSINFERIRKSKNEESWVRYRNSGNWNFNSYLGNDNKGKFYDRLKIDLTVKFIN